MAREIVVVVKIKAKDLASKELKSAGKNTDDFGKALGRAKGPAMQLATGALKATTAATAAFGGALTFATKKAIDFEHQLAEVTTLVDTAKVPVQTLRDLSFELAEAFPGSATEQARAMYQAISAGATSAASATATMVAANKLAVGGVTELSVAIDGITSAVNAFGETPEKVMNTFFVAVKRGKTTASELASSIGNLGPIARTAGLSLDQAVAPVVALTKVGVSTAEAVTQVRSALTGLFKIASSKGKTDLAASLGLDVSAERLQKVGLVQFVDELANKSGITDAQLLKLFGRVEGFSGILQIASKGVEETSATLEEMRTNLEAGEEAFQKMNATTKSAIGRMAGTFSVLTVKVGDHINKSTTLAGVVEGLNLAFARAGQAVDAMAFSTGMTATQFVQLTQELVGKTLVAFGEFVDVVGVSGLALARVGRVMGIFLGGVGKLTKAIGILAKASITGWAVAMQDVNEVMTDAIENTLPDMIAAFSEPLDTSGVTRFRNALVGTGEAILETSGHFDVVGTAAQDAGETWGEMFDSVAAGAEDWAARMKKAAQEAAQAQKRAADERKQAAEAARREEVRRNKELDESIANLDLAAEIQRDLAHEEGVMITGRVVNLQNLNSLWEDVAESTGLSLVEVRDLAVAFKSLDEETQKFFGSALDFMKMHTELQTSAGEFEKAQQRIRDARDQTDRLFKLAESDNRLLDEIDKERARQKEERQKKEMQVADKMAQTTLRLGKSIISIASNAKSAGDAFEQFAKSIGLAVAEAIAMAALKTVFQSILNVGTGGAGGFFGNLLGGLFGARTGGDVRGFQAGGVAGVDSVPALLAPGELVVSAQGRRELEAGRSAPELDRFGAQRGGGSTVNVNLSMNTAGPPAGADATRWLNATVRPWLQSRQRLREV